MPKQGTPTCGVTLRVDVGLRNALEEVATRRGVSVAELLRQYAVAGVRADITRLEGEIGNNLA